MKEPTTTSWTIHTMGGPIRRVFSTVEIAKQWAIVEWTFPKTSEQLIEANVIRRPRSASETAAAQRRLDEYNAEHFARYASGTVVIEPDHVDEASVSFGIHYEGPHEEVFATICQQQHCACCGRVVATRSDIDGEWCPTPNDHDRWPTDLEIEP